MTDGTVAIRDTTYTDAHGVRIHVRVWEAASPRGVVQLLHGVGEHSGRYDHVGRALALAGFTTWADDHRGHGRTGLEQHDATARLGTLGPGGHRAAVAAVHQLTGIIAAAHPDLPLILVGHSWGSLMAQILLNEHAEDYDAAVLIGSAHRTLRHMNGGDLNARHKHLGHTGLEWLSRDESVHHAFKADPLTTDRPLLKLFGLPDTMRLLGRPARDFTADLPLLLMVGADDPLGGPASISHLARDYRDRSGLTDVTVKVYAGARHEILNETNKDEVIGDLIAWLGLHTDGHVPGRA
ncbi:alpha/beta fold hydrolase [Demequina zhanjiangensis]|uniref:Alpha/beta fold hydrolase n=1 Tax=Demequina zhanjiangensis TaxID=3051659 RepID=A0ABT8FZ28_9MICO|nr:alpha/beta fold hydrolase [Demequina sp. SYSU T00b26]MDN4472155.1 alpha/beta fold hydrolase [Demequina sp. SYSU T00b26]